MGKKKKILAIIILIFLVIAGSALVVYVRKPTFLFPEAAADNISGSVKITISITSPYTAQGELIGQLNQDETGYVTGTVSDPSGEDTRTITGQVTVDEFVSDPTSVVFAVEDATGKIVDYEAEVVFEGTVLEEGNRISGMVTGDLIRPLSGPISGTFYSIRQSTTVTNTPIPTDTLLPTNTSLPTETPLPTNTPTHTVVPTNTVLPEATSTQIPTLTNQPTSQPTNTPVPPTNTLAVTSTLSPTNTAVLQSTSTPVVYSENELPNTGAILPTMLLVIFGGLMFLF